MNSILRYPESTESERGQRLRTALSMAESIDEGRKIEQRKRAKEKRKIMEKERKKAIRAAKQRQKEAKMKKNIQFKVWTFVFIFMQYSKCIFVYAKYLKHYPCL